MRSPCLLLILLVAINISDNLAAERCPEENCLAPNQCEISWTGAECADTQKPCCSIVKPEFRTACRHHGGECMKNCNPSLQRPVEDCPANTVCCVLV